MLLMSNPISSDDTFTDEMLMMMQLLRNHTNDIQLTSYLLDCRPAMKSTPLLRMIPTEIELNSIFSLYSNFASFSSQFVSN